MQQQTSNKTFSWLAYLSLTPLIVALMMSLYHAFDWANYTGLVMSFARLNSYIYAHSYAALLLAFFAGIQIGQSLNNPNRWYVVFNFFMLWLAWLSYHSFADAQGMLLLLCCWLAALLIDVKAHQQNKLPLGYSKLKFKVNTVVIASLLLLTLINH